MTLQQLRYVAMVAEKGTMTEAATELYISQPSLTKSIRELEKELEIVIFERTNKGIVVSHEGEQFLAYARQVIDAALKYGYDSPESFGRAFSRFHGITPVQAKSGRAKLKSFSRLSVKLILDGGSTMKYRIEKMGELEVIVKKKNFSCDLETSNRQLPEFWGECWTDKTMLELFERNPKEGIFGDALLGLCLSEIPQANEFVYAIGMMYDGGPVAEELSVEKIPAHTWAVFECVGPIPEAFQKMQHTVYSEFFPSSEYQPCSGLDIQVYPTGDMQSDKYVCQLWIPIEKNL